MATPTCVQHVQTASNENYENGNAFKVNLPNPTLANNCIVVFVTYGYSASRTITVTDDQSSTWPAATRTINDTGNVLTTAAFVLPNCAAGIRQITFTFNASLQGFHASISEWYNIATSSPGDGSAGATAVVPAASGSFTTTTNGDLILHYAIGSGWGRPLNAGFNSGATTLTKATGYTKLNAHKLFMAFTEYTVQATAGATNPSASVSGGTSNTEPFNSITLALKNATAGTAPSSTAVRVFGIMHQAIPDVPSTGNYTVWAPTVGNLSVLITSYPKSGLPINSATGAVGGAYTLVAPGTAPPQAVYKTSNTPSDDEVITLNLTNGSSGKLQYMVYDIVNAGAFDTSASAVLGSFGAGAVAHCPDITPGVSVGITIATAEFGTGPPNAVTSPSGALFDCGFYTGYTDLSPWDSGDAHGHLVFASNAAQNWTWTDTQATGNANGLALTFAQASSSHTIAIGQVTETDSVFAATHVKTRAIGQPSDSETSQPMAVNGSTLYLDVAHGRELRNHSNVPWSNVNGWAWAWYDSESGIFGPGSPGAPQGSGTFNTNANGEAILQVPGTALAAGQTGLLLVRHPSYPGTPVQALLRVPLGP